MKKEFLGFPRDAKIYLISEFFRAGFFTWPFWYGFATGNITPSQFGIYLAVTYLVGMAAEVPGGAFADTYGRKMSATLGSILLAAVPLIIFFNGSFVSYLLTAVIGGIASALISGSLESLVYELPGMTKEMYRKVMVQETFFFQSGLIAAAGFGGLMFNINHFLPFAAQALSFIFTAFLISIMSAYRPIAQDIKDARTRRQMLNQYAAMNKAGFLHLFQVRRLWPLLVFGSTLSVLLWMGIENLNEAALIHYNIAPSGRGLLLAGTKIIGLVILNGIVIKKIKTDTAKLVYLGVTMSTVLILYALGIKSLFLFAFLLFSLVSSVQDNFIRPIIHDHVEDKWRATSISSYSFITSALVAIVSIFIGGLLQTKGILFVQRFMLLALLLISIPALILYLRKPAKRTV